jgi:hypothetical protein
MSSDERGADTEGSGLSLRRIGLMLGLVFAVALVVVVGSRLSSEAMAVIVGIVCGVAAGIPTSVLLLAVMSRRETQRHQRSVRQRQAGIYPPMVVIQGGTPQALPPGSQAEIWPAAPPGPQIDRQYHVVGGEELVGDGIADRPGTVSFWPDHSWRT